MRDFRNVDAWKKAHALVLEIYEKTKVIPKEEIFGVTMQLRRTSIAITSRIAEGAGRSNNAEYAVDLRRAAAETNNLEYLVLLAHDLGYWKNKESVTLGEEVVEVRKMIFGLLRTL